jgi:hypothetical protein
VKMIRLRRGYALPFLVLILTTAAWGTARAQVMCNGGGDPVAQNAARVCWTNATTDTAGVSLPATGVGSLKTTRLQRAHMATATTSCDFAAPADPLETKDFAPTVGGYLYENLPDGRHCFRARHVNNEGIMSDWSAVVWKAIVAPRPPGKPNAPTVTVDSNPTPLNPATEPVP